MVVAFFLYQEGSIVVWGEQVILKWILASAHLRFVSRNASQYARVVLEVALFIESGPD